MPNAFRAVLAIIAAIVFLVIGYQVFQSARWGISGLFVPFYGLYAAGVVLLITGPKTHSRPLLWFACLVGSLAIANLFATVLRGFNPGIWLVGFLFFLISCAAGMLFSFMITGVIAQEKSGRQLSLPDVFREPTHGEDTVKNRTEHR